MSMAGHGLVKLLEELGELVQVTAKKLAYGDTDEHPDGNGSLGVRLENEIADVNAAISFVCETHNLSRDRINARWIKKLEQYHQWDKEGREYPGGSSIDVYLVDSQLELIKSGIVIPPFPLGQEPTILRWGDRVFQKVLDLEGEKPGYPLQYKEVSALTVS